MNSEQTTRANWKKIYRILSSIDQHEVTFYNPKMQKEWDEWRWFAFREDPHGFIVRCADRYAEAIWQAVERRME